MSQHVAETCLVWQEACIETLEPLADGLRRVVVRPRLWRRPQAGQHLDIRLTSDDGYQAQRSYSLLSPPECEDVYELGIERLTDGEVSTWFHDHAVVGDTIEIIGPVGGHFVWNASDETPALLIGGGSGAIPLLSMVAHHVRHATRAPMFLCLAARTLDHVPRWDDLQRWEREFSNFRIQLALSRQTLAPRPQDRSGRLQQEDLASALHWLEMYAVKACRAYVCGRNGFVESVVAMLRELRLPDDAIRTERFGG